MTGLAWPAMDFPPPSHTVNAAAAGSRLERDCTCAPFCTFLDPGQVFVGTQHVSSSPSPNRDPLDSLPSPTAFVHPVLPLASLPISSSLPPSDREGFIPIPPSTSLRDESQFSPSPFGRESGEGEGDGEGEERERERESEREEGRREGRGAGAEDERVGRLPFGRERELPGGTATGGGIGEAWRVTVTVQTCDLVKGYLCGSMEAHNVPWTDTSVVTFWEGEIVDNRNNYFITAQWEATRETDISHWSRFPEFAPLQESVQRDGGKHIDLTSFPFIFMRWKEKFFMNVGPECGLTIAGFYYICFCRADGTVTGFYFDPNSSPFQKLKLAPQRVSKYGFTFASFDLS